MQKHRLFIIIFLLGLLSYTGNVYGQSCDIPIPKTGWTYVFSVSDLENCWETTDEDGDEHTWNAIIFDNTTDDETRALAPTGSTGLFYSLSVDVDSFSNWMERTFIAAFSNWYDTADAGSGYTYQDFYDGYYYQYYSSSDWIDYVFETYYAPQYPSNYAYYYNLIRSNPRAFDVAGVSFDLNPENWLITPRIILPCQANSITLKYKIKTVDETYTGDKLYVYVSTTANTLASMTMVQDGITTTNEYDERSVDLTAYAGQKIYLGFAHKNSYDISGIYLADIKIEVGGAIDTISTPTTIIICDNQTPYTWTQNGQNYNTSSTYYDTTQYGGCDTIFTLNLTVNPTYDIPKDTSGHFLTVQGTTYHASGSYPYNGTTTKGCDSIITYNFTFIPDTTHVYGVDSCSNTAVKNDTATIVPYGYDSIVITHYTPRPIYSFTQKDTVLLNDCPYSWHGQSLSASGTYYDNRKTAIYNCDSIYTLTLLVRDTQYVASTITGCDSVVYNAITYKATTSFSDTTTHDGFDTIYTVTIQIDTVEIDTQTIHDIKYTWNSTEYHATKTFLKTGEQCDSVHIVLDTPISYTTENICLPRSSGIPPVEDDTTIIHAGSYDSLAVTQYVIYFKEDTTVYDTAASPNLPHIWEGHSLDTTSSLTETLQTHNAGQCDSVVHYHLHVRDTIRDIQTFTGCDSMVLAYNDIHYYGDTIFNDTTRHDGRDTIFTFNIKIDTVETVDSTVWQPMASQPYHYHYNWDSDFDGTPETYQDTITFLHIQGGCDSIRIMLPVIHKYDTQCSQREIYDNSITYDTSVAILDDYLRVIPAHRSRPWDTIVITYNTYYASFVDTHDVYGSYIVWRGNVYDQEGRFDNITDTLRTIYGCDSIVTFNIIIDKKRYLTIDSCNGRATYKDVTYYRDTLIFDTLFKTDNPSRYDTVNYVTIRLHPSYDTTVKSFDSSYEVNGNTYTASTIIPHHSRYGCDSIIRLKLAIRDSVNYDSCMKTLVAVAPRTDTIFSGNDFKEDTIRTTVYQSRYTYYDTTPLYGPYVVWNGKTYHDEGEYEDITTLRSQYGCDSIVNIHIFIRKTGYRFIRGCDSSIYIKRSYTVNDTMIVYRDTDFVDTVVFLENYDSLVNVSIRILPTSESDSTVWSTYYTWGGVNYSEGRSFVVRAANGCDSTIHFKMVEYKTIDHDTCQPTASPIPARLDSIRSATGDTLVTNRYNVHLSYRQTFAVYGSYVTCNGNEYREEGQYSCTQNLHSMYGCDSIVTLNITISKSRLVSIHGCDSTEYKGVKYYSNYTFEDTVTYGPDNDSIFHVVITVNPTVRRDSLVPFPATSYTWNSIDYPSQAVTRVTATASNGCDSIFTIRGVIYDTIRSTNVLPCQRDSSSSRTDTSVVPLNAYEAQVIYVTHIVNPSKETELSAITVTRATAWLEGDTTYYVFPGTSDTLRNSGAYTHTFRTTKGCDSIVRLNVTFVTPDPDTLRVGTVYLYDTVCGMEERSDTTKKPTTFVSDSGHVKVYDTILITYYRYNYANNLPDSTIISQMERFSDLRYFVWPNGDSIGQDGTYTAHLTSAYGCDSSVTLTLLFVDTLRHNETNTICSTRDFDTTRYDTVAAAVTGRSRTNIYGTTYSYRSTLYDTVDTIGFSFFWKGTTYNRDTCLSEHRLTTAGCDSVSTIRFLVPREEEREENYKECNPDIETSYIDTVYYDTTVKNVTYHTTTTTTHCPSYHKTYTVPIDTSIMWHTIRPDMDTMIHDTLKTTEGCDSIITKTYHVKYTCITFGVTIDTVGCAPFAYNGKTYGAETLRIYDTLSNANIYGCDSIRQIEAVIYPSYSDSVSYELPYEGGGFRWLRKTYLDSGIYYDTVRTTHGCDSAFKIIITRADPPIICDTVESDTIINVCNGLRWNGTFLRFSGTYVDTVLRENGCDSVVTLYLTVRQPSERGMDTTACDYIYWRGHTYSTTTDTMLKLGTAVNGCDSMEYITFHIKKSTTAYDTLVGCGSLQYDNVTFNGTTDYTANPTRNRVGCDSIVKVRIVIYRTYIKDSMATACDSFSWNGLSYTHTGTYSFNQKTIRNCDSTINLYLTIKNSQHDEVTKEDCEFISYNHKDYDHSGIYMDTLEPTPDGCLHTVSLRLTVYPASNIYLDTHVCDSFLWHSTTYRSNGEGSFHSQTPNQYGCDSNEYLKVNITESSSSRIPITACESYLWFDSIFTESTNYIHHTKNHVGCDSAIMLRLTIRSNDTTDTTVRACNFFRWRNRVYTHSGTDTVVLNDGHCVMVDVLNLTLGEDTRKEFNKTVCDSFNLVWLDRDSIWHDSTYTMSTTTTRYMHSVLGCDSVVTMNLDVRRSTFSDVYASECNRYRWHDSVYTQSTDSAQFKRYNRAGCDSVVTLHLAIHYSTDIHDTVWACDRYLYNNRIYTQDAQLMANRGFSIFGCDSTYTLTLLMVYSGKEYFDTITACNEFEWIDGNTYDHDTMITIALTDTFYGVRAIHTTYGRNTMARLGDTCTCDYTRTLLLSMHYDTYQHDTVSACHFYEWNNQPYYTSAIDSVLDTDAIGCVFHHTLNLSMYYDQMSYFDTTVCDTLQLSDGIIYTKEVRGLLHNMGKTVHGCDSTLHLTLHIGNKYTESTITVCDSFTFKGKTYTTSRTIFDTIPIGRCDSIRTLRLQIDHTSLLLEELAACDSFTWRNGKTYYATCGDIDSVHFADACDSVYVLLLTINPKVITETSITTNQPYEWNNLHYMTNGTYYQTFRAANGCDSIAMLNIFFTPFPTPKIYNHSNRVVMVNHYPYGEHSTRVDYYGYRWYVNGILVDGANDDNLALSNGRGINGCITMEAAVDEEQEHWLTSNMICFGYVGIDDLTDEGAVVFNVYPNPTTSGSTVSISTNLTEAQLYGATLSLFDRQGREILAMPYSQAQASLSIHQPAGLYLLQIRTADGKTHATKVLVR